MQRGERRRAGRGRRARRRRGSPKGRCRWTTAPALTWSLGWTSTPSRWARVATTSLTFMLVLVPEPGLEDVDREVVVVRRRRRPRRRPRRWRSACSGVERAEVGVGPRGGGLDAGQRVDQRGLERAAADREVVDGPLGLRPPQRVGSGPGPRPWSRARCGSRSRQRSYPAHRHHFGPAVPPNWPRPAWPPPTGPSVRSDLGSGFRSWVDLTVAELGKTCQEVSVTPVDAQHSHQESARSTTGLPHLGDEPGAWRFPEPVHRGRGDPRRRRREWCQGSLLVLDERRRTGSGWRVHHVESGVESVAVVVHPNGEVYAFCTTGTSHRVSGRCWN